MIGEAWRSRAVQALLGPARSSLVPSRLHVGWLDSEGDLIAMSGTSVLSAAFEASGDGVVNTTSIDAGVAGSGWVIAGVGLFDAPSGGDVVLSASTSGPVEPDEGAPLSIAAGALAFTVVVDA